MLITKLKKNLKNNVFVSTIKKIVSIKKNVRGIKSDNFNKDNEKIDSKIKNVQLRGIKSDNFNKDNEKIDSKIKNVQLRGIKSENFNKDNEKIDSMNIASTKNIPSPKIDSMNIASTKNIPSPKINKKRLKNAIFRAVVSYDDLLKLVDLNGKEFMTSNAVGISLNNIKSKFICTKFSNKLINSAELLSKTSENKSYVLLSSVDEKRQFYNLDIFVFFVKATTINLENLESSHPLQDNWEEEVKLNWTNLYSGAGSSFFVPRSTNLSFFTTLIARNYSFTVKWEDCFFCGYDNINIIPKIVQGISLTEEYLLQVFPISKSGSFMFRGEIGKLRFDEYFDQGTRAQKLFTFFYNFLEILAVHHIEPKHYHHHISLVPFEDFYSFDIYIEIDKRVCHFYDRQHVKVVNEDGFDIIFDNVQHLESVKSYYGSKLKDRFSVKSIYHWLRRNYDPLVPGGIQQLKDQNALLFIMNNTFNYFPMVLESGKVLRTRSSSYLISDGKLFEDSAFYDMNGFSETIIETAQVNAILTRLTPQQQNKLISCYITLHQDFEKRDRSVFKVFYSFRSKIELATMGPGCKYWSKYTAVEVKPIPSHKPIPSDNPEESIHSWLLSFKKPFCNCTIFEYDLQKKKLRNFPRRKPTNEEKHDE